MARDSGERPRKARFSKSGHTSHQPRPTPQWDSPTYHGQAGYDNGGGFTPPVYNRAPESPPAAPGGAAGGVGGVGKAALNRTNQAARLVTTKVISASKADGAHESGLTALIWNQVLSYGADAMITVALAGTVFFGASTHAQRGNVLLYLLITMAPFAVVAPIIGPALDRLSHGRRWTMAGTAIGRAALALIMAGHSSQLLVLYPCALGSLVLSKAYAVVRAAAAPRLVPPGMTLTKANARLTIFGLASTLVLGGFVGIVIKSTGSYTLGLVLTAVGYGICAYFAFRLPSQVDSVPDARRHPRERPRQRAHERAPLLPRIRDWARRGYDPHVVVALQGESAMRLLSGLLTIYLAFYIESTTHGLEAAAQLGAVVFAAGFGNFSGTAIGTKVRIARPELVIVASVAVTAAVCLIIAISFGIVFAVIGMYLSAVGNALCKIALDALIQRDVAESQRSSAFARSETFLQLAWVLGAAIGVVLPTTSLDAGAIGFWVAAVVLGGVAIVTALRMRVINRAEVAAQAQAGTQRIPSGQVDLRKTRPY